MNSPPASPATAPGAFVVVPLISVFVAEPFITLGQRAVDGSELVLG